MAIYLGNTPIKPIGISKVFVGPHQVYQSGPAHTDYLYFTSPSTGYIAYETFGTVNVNIQTSTDMTTWEAWDGTQKTISNNAKLYVRNKTKKLCLDADNYVRFTTASGITLMGGNIMSMINYSDLTNYCFFGLFSDCTYLDTLDDFIMPATTLAEACYQSMFYGCSTLTSTPVLPATTLVNNCYYYMFYNCSSLTVNQNTGEGVALLTCPDTTGVTTPVDNMFTSTCGSFTGTPTTGNVYYRPECYLYFTGTGTIEWTYTYSLPSVNLQTSTDKSTWTDWTVTTTRTLSSSKLYVRNTKNTLNSNSNYLKFVNSTGTSDSVIAGGNMMSMVNRAALSDSSFFYLFNGCRKLDITSDFILPSKTAPYRAYYGMFTSCSKLTKAPKLPATRLSDECYDKMFYGCSSLKKAPDLPATTLKSSCYYWMFYSCTSLIFPPQISATTLASYCCNGMFQGCSNLLVTTSSTGVSFFRCPNYSTMVSNPVLDMFTSTGGSFTGTPSKKTTYYYVEPYLYFTGTGTIKYTINGTVRCNIQTSTDKVTWTNWSVNTAKQLTTSKLYVRNTLNTLSSGANYNDFKFVTSGSVIAGGNMMSMLNYANLSEYCFYGLFSGCTGLDLASDFSLPWKTLKTDCYYRMFYGCTSLKTPPAVLPATTLANECYNGMFNGCKSLLTAPQIKATSFGSYTYCCYMMFNNCSNLLVSEGSGDFSFFKCPSSISQGAVKYMFNNTGGTFTEDPTAGKTYYYVEPYLYFTTSTSGTIAYSKNGTVTCNIQTSSDKINWNDWDGTETTLTTNKLYVRNTLNTLSTSNSDRVTFATTGSVLVGGNCNSMINHSALSDYCFYGLFANCSTLDLTNDFNLPAATLATYCYGSMFMRCTWLTNPPSVLPATILAERCYGQMFWGCTSLTKAPNIPATTLATNSCGAMFGNCSSLNVSEGSGGTAFFTCPDMTGVTSPVVMMFDGTGGSFTEDPTSGNTYYYNQPATLTNNESLKNYIQSNNITSCSICKHSEVPEGTTDVTSAITGLSNGYAGVLNNALYISGLDDSVVMAAPDMSSLFGSANLLTSLSVSNLDTRNVTKMEGMFISLPYVTTLDVSNFNTSNVTNMSSMFNMDSRLQTIIGLENFDTSKVIYFSMMFKGCAALTTLDLTSFSSDNCQYIFSMFEECTTLANIYVEESWYPTHTGSVLSGSGNNVFKDCPALPGYSATATNSYAYCRLVTEATDPGYFTLKP